MINAALKHPCNHIIDVQLNIINICRAAVATCQASRAEVRNPRHANRKGSYIKHGGIYLKLWVKGEQEGLSCAIKAIADFKGL